MFLAYGGLPGNVALSVCFRGGELPTQGKAAVHARVWTGANTGLRGVLLCSSTAFQTGIGKRQRESEVVECGAPTSPNPRTPPSDYGSAVTATRKGAGACPWKAMKSMALTVSAGVGFTHVLLNKRMVLPRRRLSAFCPTHAIVKVLFSSFG